MVSYFSNPPTISAPAYFCNKLQDLSIAIYVLFGSNPFSNLLLASLLSISFDVILIFTGLKIADSIIIFFVFVVTSVSKPPITPANPIAFSPSDITMFSSDKILSIPSSVVSFSPFFAILTSSLPFNVSAS